MQTPGNANEHMLNSRMARATLASSQAALREEFTKLLQSNPTAEKFERARRVLQAVNESEIPFIAYGDTFYRSAALVFRNLLGHILDYCSFRDIVAVGHLSQSLRIQARQYLNRCLNALLRRYVVDTEGFLQIMKKTRGIISGSSALSLIDRGGWQSDDLDIYVPNGTPRDEFLVHLAKEGYEIQITYGTTESQLKDNWPLPTYHRSGICRICKLVRKSKEDPSVILSAIDLIECTSETSAILPIFFYHSTVVMNWISHDSIVILYPSYTFARRGVEHNLWGKSEWRIKYFKRGFLGFEFWAKRPEIKIRCGATCPVLRRSTDDAGTLVVPLVNGSFIPEERVEWMTGEQKDVVPACTNRLCPNCPKFELRAQP